MFKTCALISLCAYVGLAADSPGVREMVERLRSNQPAGSKPDQAGAAFIYREGIESATTVSDLARVWALLVIAQNSSRSHHTYKFGKSVRSWARAPRRPCSSARYMATAA